MLPTVRDETTKSEKRRRSQPSRPGRLFGVLVFIIFFSILGSRMPSFRTLSSKAQLYQRFKRWKNRPVGTSAGPAIFGSSNDSQFSLGLDSSTHPAGISTMIKEVILPMHQGESGQTEATSRHDEGNSTSFSEQTHHAKKGASPPSQQDSYASGRQIGDTITSGHTQNASSTTQQARGHAQEGNEALRQDTYTFQGSKTVTVTEYISTTTNQSAITASTPTNRKDKGKNIVTHTRPHDGTSVTLVTAYFRIKSKHSDSEYDTWMRNTLSVHDPMVIFTNRDFLETMRTLRSHALDRTLFIPFELNETVMSTQRDLSFWENQLSIDPERERHKSYELYWIWNEKASWMRRAARVNPFGTTHFCWIDTGYLRHAKFNGVQLAQRLPADVQDSQV
jgi:hypothetical protein